MCLMLVFRQTVVCQEEQEEEKEAALQFTQKRWCGLVWGYWVISPIDPFVNSMWGGKRPCVNVSFHLPRR